MLFIPFRRVSSFPFPVATESAKIMRVVRLIVALSGIALLVSCGGSSSNGNGAASANMTGTWVFTMTPTDFSTDMIQATVPLTQAGNSVDGQVTLTPGAGTSCGTGGVMSGMATGNALSLQLTQSQSSLTLTGAANMGFTSASGTYTATAGQCLQNGGTGSWAAIKQ